MGVEFDEKIKDAFSLIYFGILIACFFGQPYCKVYRQVIKKNKKIE